MNIVPGPKEGQLRRGCQSHPHGSLSGIGPFWVRLGKCFPRKKMFGLGPSLPKSEGNAFLGVVGGVALGRGEQEWSEKQ